MIELFDWLKIKHQNSSDSTNSCKKKKPHDIQFPSLKKQEGGTLFNFYLQLVKPMTQPLWYKEKVN